MLATSTLRRAWRGWLWPWHVPFPWHLVLVRAVCIGLYVFANQKQGWLHVHYMCAQGQSIEDNDISDPDDPVLEQQKEKWKTVGATAMLQVLRARPNGKKF